MKEQTMNQTNNLTEFEVPIEEDGERLDRFLTSLYPAKSRSNFQKLIRRGDVFINAEPASKTGAMLHEGDTVGIRFPEPDDTGVLPEEIPLDILYEDDALLIVNKPKGMVVHPAPGHLSGTLVNAVLFHCKGSLSGINGDIRPGIVHRIDKDTTGSLIVCKTDRAHQSIGEQIKEHTVHRIYHGIVVGQMPEEEGTIDAPIGRSRRDRKKMAVLSEAEVINQTARPAVTHYRVLERFKSTCYMEFRLETGRTHQIRVHSAHIGHPIYGDTVYGGEKNGHGLSGQTLHAMTIGFVHPETHEYMEFHAPLPAYFEALLQTFRNEL